MKHQPNNPVTRRFWPVCLLAALFMNSCAQTNTAKAPESTKKSDTKAATKTQGAVETILASLTMTDRERTILAETRDGTASVEEAGFYMLMGKIAKFPKLSQVESKQLDAPAYANLIRQPSRYRYQPIKLTAMIYQVEKLTVDDQKISATPYWPNNKAIWALYGLADGGDKNQPLIIYSTVEPLNLPKASNVLRDGRSEYKDGLQYSVNGVFFKLLEKTDTDAKQVRKYPAILAWQLTDRSSDKTSPMANSILGGIVLLGVVLGLAVFIFLKKKLKAEPKTWAERTGVFSKEDFSSQQDNNSDLNDNESEEDEAVDPALAEAAKQYRKEHGLDDFS